MLTFEQPSAIMAVFLFIGSAVLLYIKASYPPGPLLFATLFGLIAIGTKAPQINLASNSNLFIIDITVTTAVLFPYPYYSVGALLRQKMYVS